MTSRRFPAALAALGPILLWIAGGCGEVPDRRAPEGRDSAGVRIVTAPAVTEGAGLPLAREEVTEARGRTASPGAEAAARGEPDFSSISAVDAALDGTLYVLDRRQGRVTVLDPQGRRVLRRFGRPGDGPGEFRAASALALLADGRVMIGERMPLRFHLFGGRGRIQRTVRLEGPGGAGARPAWSAGPAMADWGWPEEEGLLVRVLTLAADPGKPPVNRMLRAGLDGGVRRVLLEWPEPGSFAEPPPVFTPRRRWSPAPAGGLHVTDGSGYEVRTLDGEGTVARILRRPAERRPVTRRERDRALERFRAAMAEGGATPALVERVAGELRVARELPAIHALWTDRSTGELWVGIPRVDTASGELGAASYHIYRRDGRLLGGVAAPGGFALLTVRGRRLYGRSTDVLGIPRLRVFRLVAGSGRLPPAP